jgi:hypothetical protein
MASKVFNLFGSDSPGLASRLVAAAEKKVRNSILPFVFDLI